MAANVNVIETARIVANGGEITSDRYKGDTTSTYNAGELCALSAGTLVPVLTTMSAGTIENDAAPFNAAAQYFVVLAASAATAGFLPAQKVEADTVFEGYVVDTTDPADVTMNTTDIGKVYEGYIATGGKLAVNNVATKGVFKIVDVDDNYEPYRAGGDFEEDATGVRHQRVRFSIIASKLL